MNNVYVVILAGGKGERLWPLSTGSMPKYGLRTFGKTTLLQQAYKRARIALPKARILVVTQKAQVPFIKRQLLFLKNKDILAEPVGRNTAAAIGLAAIKIAKEDPQGVMVVLPADHFMINAKGFSKAVHKAISEADKDLLVTSGIKPTFASTGYGYIKIKAKGKRQLSPQIYNVERFIEKPNLNKAKKFLKGDNYLWNSGIFVWKAEVILKAIKKHMSKLGKALLEIDKSLGGPRYKEKLFNVYKDLKNTSIDYGVLEKSKNVKVIKTNILWDDLGTWEALTRICKKDKNGNVIKAHCKILDTTDSVIVGDSKHLIATLGVNNIVVVHTPGATLVCSRDASEHVKKLLRN